MSHGTSYPCSLLPVCPPNRAYLGSELGADIHSVEATRQSAIDGAMGGATPGNQIRSFEIGHALEFAIDGVSIRDLLIASLRATHDGEAGFIDREILDDDDNLPRGYHSEDDTRFDAFIGAIRDLGEDRLRALSKVVGGAVVQFMATHCPATCLPLRDLKIDTVPNPEDEDPEAPPAIAADDIDDGVE